MERGVKRELKTLFFPQTHPAVLVPVSAVPVSNDHYHFFAQVVPVPLSHIYIYFIFL